MTTTPFSAEGVSDDSLSKSLQNVPRYLFRVFDHQSPGTTMLSQVSSPAYDSTSKAGEEDLYQMDPQSAAADNLNKHLWWQCDASCNLMSWTSSLLFALQYTLYRHKTNRRDTPLSEVKILVVDTHQFSKATFARDLEAIDSFWGQLQKVCGSMSPERTPKTLSKLRNLRRSDDFYFGEYLSQGKLIIDPARACIVSVGALEELGLFQIYPQLGDRETWNKWAIRVKELRTSLSPVEASHYQKLMDVAAAFGSFKIPVALMLFSMSGEGFETSFSDYSEALLEGYPREFISPFSSRRYLSRCTTH